MTNKPLSYHIRKLFSIIAFSLLSVFPLQANNIVYTTVPYTVDSCDISINSVTAIENDSLADFLADVDTIKEMVETKPEFVYNDTVWNNTVIGSKVHLQRLGGIDTLTTAKKSILILLV